MEWLINRRRMTINRVAPSPTVHDYIQDGLIFQLDGLEKGTNENSWTDIVGGMIFTGDAVSTNNGFIFNTTSLTCNSLLPANENYTIECLFTPSTTSAGCLFSSADGNSINQICLFKLSTTKLLFLERQNTCAITTVTGKAKYVSLNLSSCVEDGTSCTIESTTDYYTGDGKTNIGVVGGTNRRFYGTIHAIRVYSKKLSLEEQTINYKIDKQRFKL